MTDRTWVGWALTEDEAITLMDALRTYDRELRATPVRSRLAFEAKLEQLVRIEILYVRLAEARDHWPGHGTCG